MSRFDEQDQDSEVMGVADSERWCPACSRHAARLLVESASYEFYYCFHCREWSRGRYPNPKALFPLNDARLSKALTRFYIWKLEFASGSGLFASLQSAWRWLTGSVGNELDGLS